MLFLWWLPETLFVTFLIKKFKISVYLNLKIILFKKKKIIENNLRLFSLFLNLWNIFELWKIYFETFWLVTLTPDGTRHHDIDR